MFLGLHLIQLQAAMIAFVLLVLCTCASGIQLPQHWVAYLGHVILRYEHLPSPRPTSVITPRSLGVPFDVQEV